MSPILSDDGLLTRTRGDPVKKPFYKVLYVQVLFAIACGILLGAFYPSDAVAMKPLGDGFIKLIKMIIAPVIFCTVVSGIAGMQDIKKIGRVGGKALLYFEVISTFALVIGLFVANIMRPGAGFNADPATLDTKAIAEFTEKAKHQSTIDFLMNIIPNTVVDAFAKGDILQVLLIAILFGFSLSLLGERGKPVTKLIDELSSAIFGVVGIVMKVAPLGAFGAMAFTIGKYGIASLMPLAKLMGCFYLTCFLFVVVVLGTVARLTGFSIFKFINYIKEELLIVLGTSSSESALPSLMTKLERLGCSKSVVGLVVPTGYSFNLDGTNIYMTMAALFVAQATNTDLTLMQELTILGVAMLTSKGASGITGAGFITLAATLAVVPTIPVAGMALILGIDRFMSECRALTNFVGNGVASVVVSHWEKELNHDTLHKELNNPGSTVTDPDLQPLTRHAH
ncbi:MULTISPECIES: dicarboxylate/amino acid:cation symporter [unclassified Duganella]|uniref:dicarboxylate/amino acid:cation symporter n=1 Tax=unclassified Duganella TaxID=2636909 RepID=UPI001C3C812B|nr:MULTISPECIES: dicarboxylate/amino acid:cation symporter [unclassified Duganella]